MRMSAIVLAVALLAGGCFNRQAVALKMPIEQYAKINKQLAGHSVTVRYVGGRFEDLHDLSISGDSLDGAVTLFADRTAVAPLSRVISLELRSSMKGFVQGAIIGAGPGALLGLFGVVLGEAVVGIASWGSEELSAGDQARIMVTFVAYGAGVGGLIGALRKARTVYTFQPSFTQVIEPAPLRMACSRGPCRSY